MCIRCSGNKFTKPLPSNGYIFWLHYPGFQLSCHIAAQQFDRLQYWVYWWDGIYEFRQLRWAQCRDIHTKFRKDWFRYSAVNGGATHRHTENMFFFCRNKESKLMRHRVTFILSVRNVGKNRNGLHSDSLPFASLHSVPPLTVTGQYATDSRVNTTVTALHLIGRLCPSQVALGFGLGVHQPLNSLFRVKV
jgi:hypothetical protein